MYGSIHTEKELEEESEIDSELVYRKFVIYPFKDRVNIRKKLDKDTHTASIGIDWVNLGFFVEEDDTVTSIKSFNEYLLGTFETTKYYFSTGMQLTSYWFVDV